MRDWREAGRVQVVLRLLPRLFAVALDADPLLMGLAKEITYRIFPPCLEVFAGYPDSKIILGHLGHLGHLVEPLSFSLWRIEQAPARLGNRDISFSYREYFRRHS